MKNRPNFSSSGCVYYIYIYTLVNMSVWSRQVREAPAIDKLSEFLKATVQQFSTGNVTTGRLIWNKFLATFSRPCDLIVYVIQTFIQSKRVLNVLR